METVFWDTAGVPLLLNGAQPHTSANKAALVAKVTR
jgi:hypothetical protein